MNVVILWHMHQPYYVNPLTKKAKMPWVRLHAVLEKPGYNLLLHMAPLKRPSTERFGSTRHDYCWHLEIVPRFNALAGFEIGLGAFINTVYPEEAARFLRGEARA